MSKKYLHIALLIHFFFFCFISQTSAVEKKDTTKINIPFYQGFTVELDVVPLAEKLFSSGVSYGYQANVQFNLKKKYFPVIEIGHGGADKTLENGTLFSGKGMYEKIGLDFNLMKQKPGGKIYNNYLLAGLRFGSAQMIYNINNLSVYDKYWGEEISSLNYNSVKTSNFWIEVSGGIRVEVAKNIIMGWNVQNKHLLTNISNGNLYPWYIPGFGKTASSIWGFSYVIGYKF